MSVLFPCAPVLEGASIFIHPAHALKPLSYASTPIMVSMVVFTWYGELHPKLDHAPAKSNKITKQNNPKNGPFTWECHRYKTLIRLYICEGELGTLLSVH